MEQAMMSEARTPPAAAASQPNAVVTVRDLVKRFRKDDGTTVPAVDGVSLDVDEGEFVVLLGPSGCGKTTLLRTMAGLEQPDSGEIEIRGQAAFSGERGIELPPDQRRLSMIFQSYALWPHMTAAQNVAYPLRSRRSQRMSKSEAAQRAQTVLAMVGLPDIGKRYPNQLSGGQQQRVALARALVAEDDLVLFDEPLSNVDAKVREQLRLELLTMQRELGFAAVYVTHDQAEAMELADRVAVMELGRIVQVGSPAEIYDEPRSRYVAHFIGTSNELVGTVTEVAGESSIMIATPIGPVVASWRDSAVKAGDEVAVVWRPGRTRVGADAPDGPNRWLATVEASLFLGTHSEHVVTVGEHRLRLWSADTTLLERGSEVWMQVAPADARVLPVDG